MHPVPNPDKQDTCVDEVIFCQKTPENNSLLTKQVVLGYIALAAAASIWGGMYVVSKYALDFIPPPYSALAALYHGVLRSVSVGCTPAEGPLDAR